MNKLAVEAAEREQKILAYIKMHIGQLLPAPSNEVIALRFGMTKNHVVDVLNRMEQRGLIKIHRAHRKQRKFEVDGKVTP